MHVDLATEKVLSKETYSNDEISIIWKRIECTISYTRDDFKIVVRNKKNREKRKSFFLPMYMYLREWLPHWRETFSFQEHIQIIKSWLFESQLNSLFSRVHSIGWYFDILRKIIQSTKRKTYHDDEGMRLCI